MPARLDINQAGDVISIMKYCFEYMALFIMKIHYLTAVRYTRSVTPLHHQYENDSKSCVLIAG